MIRGRWSLIVAAMLFACSEGSQSDPDLRGLPDAGGGLDLAAAIDAQVDLLQSSEPDTISRQLVDNDGPCMGYLAAAAPEVELDYLAAVRLTPPGYPFTVTEVSYELGSGLIHGLEKECDASLAHTVLVFTGSAEAPDATPADLQTIPVPATGPSTEQTRTVELPLASPVTLAAGQHLFVAVEILRWDSSGKGTCLSACDGNGISHRNYLSEVVAAPFNWTTVAHALGEQFKKFSFAITAYGHP